MIVTYLYAFASVIAVSLISLVGLFTLSMREEVLKKYVFVAVSLAVGALLGDAFIHLIPEAYENIADGNTVALLVIGGIVLFFIIEKFLHWHHHEYDGDSHIHPVGKLVLFSDGVHNMIDGIIIGVSFMTDVPLGIATTIAVILHEIPQEIGDFGVLIHSGYTKARALMLNFYSALLAVFGLVIAFVIGEYAQTITTWFIPIAAGGFIYIAVADLIPELHKSMKKGHSVAQIVALAVGVLSMIALIYLE